ncbi:MAG: histidinol-phosphate aminotransferase [Cyclobacteriaceae bacterium]|nr:MAG: histidinol-phosphate aminotransferase [Cyclobacteriaceae bacterium]
MTTFNIESLIRPHLLKITPYSTARDEYRGKAEVFLDANENPYPAAWHRYPDPHQAELKGVISALKNINPEKIFIGNGSDEVIDLIIRLLCEPGQDVIVIPDPTYGMYQVSAQINHAGIIKVPLTSSFNLEARDILKAVGPRTKIIFLCSPNNPSGNLLDKNQVREILARFNGLVVVDEAYIDFSDDQGFLPELDNWPNLMIMQTLSKAYGLAGLRLGLAFARANLIKWLNNIKPPYNISHAAQALALERLRKTDEVNRQIKEIINQRNRLANQLQTLAVVEQVFPSQANFLLVRFKDARQIYNYLLQNGIIVRDRSAVLHGRNCLRITVGTPNENTKLISALQQFKP